MVNAAKNIDKEWAASLVGLRMQVPGFWWHNSWGNNNNKINTNRRRHYRSFRLEDNGSNFVGSNYKINNGFDQ